MSRALWHIQNCSLFTRLSEGQLDALGAIARMRTFPKGSAVYVPSDATDGAFLVAEGRVRLCSTTPEGKQCTLAFVEPGELFGELSILDPGEREERAEAALASTVVLLPGEPLREFMSASPELTLGITKLIGLRRRRVERRLRSLLFRSNHERLSQLLLDLAEQYGRMTAEGVQLGIRLSHHDLASIIGATRETVTTLLGEMQRDGLLIIRRQRLLLTDVPRLAQGLGVTPPRLRAAHPAPGLPTVLPRLVSQWGEAR